MIQRHRIAVAPILFAVLLASAAAPRGAQAGLGDTALALAGPLAAQFGVPAGAVTGLLESGISLDSVTQLLLISQSSGTGLDAVTKLFRGSGNDVTKTAEELDVDAADYSQEKVSAAIGEARQTAQAQAKEKTTGEASKAVDSALGGLTR